ncbi:hypothetical protein DRP05_04745 [Archaeoglobales archaeon]|nr:MAG: hypothetical protein DRP05_04745 [Archaeoglobales archaeon]
MKILMYGRLIGGIANHIYALSRELKKLGHEVDIISQKEISLIKIMDGFYYLDYPSSSKKIVKIAQNYDILHVHNCATSMELLLPSLIKIPLVNTIHVAIGGKIYGKIGFEVTKTIAKLYSKANITIALSNKSMEITKKYQRNVRLIPNGVDVEEFKPKKSTRIFDDTTIGYLGQLRREKNVESLVKACKVHGFNLAIGGTGPLYKKIKAMEDKKIKVLGFVKDAVEFYNSIDIFVLPSYAENDPLTVLEAMACGKPVITTECIKDSIKDEFGMVCGYDASSIGEAISEMLKLDFQKMGKNARKYVLKHRTWNVCAKRVEDVYRLLK